YLNIANFGAGAYGVETAAKTYFPHTPLSRLSAGQAALLAGLVQSPTRYNPYLHPRAGKARRHEGLQALVRDGKITAAQAPGAATQPVPTGRPPAIRQQGCGQANGGRERNLGYFCDYVVSYIKDSLGLTEDQLFTGGYRVYTTINPAMQLIA